MSVDMRTYASERRARLKARGRCVWCANKRGDGVLCEPCAEKNRARLRAAYATQFQPWRPGGRGRPPLSAA